MARTTTKRTPETEKRIIDALRGGNTRRAACLYAGIGETTFARWIERYADFAELIAHAEAQVEVRNVAILQRACAGYETTETRAADKWFMRTTKRTLPDGTTEEESAPVKVTEVTTITRHESDWRPALEWLKRRRPADWGDKVTQELTGANSGAIVITEVVIEKPAPAPAAAG